MDKYRTVASLPLFHLVSSEVFVPSLTLRGRFKGKKKKKKTHSILPWKQQDFFPPEDLLNISILRIYSCVNEKGEYDTSDALVSRGQSFFVLKALNQAVSQERYGVEILKSSINRFNMFFGGGGVVSFMNVFCLRFLVRVKKVSKKC